MSKYQGHPNWNHWNVSLWINNNEDLYRLALACVRLMPNRKRAAESMLQELHARKQDKTPDGAPYTVTTIRHAMRHMQ